MVTEGAARPARVLDANSSYLTAAEYKHYRRSRPTERLTSALRFKTASDMPPYRCNPGRASREGGHRELDIFESIEGRSSAICRWPRSTVYWAANLVHYHRGSCPARRAEPQKVVIPGRSNHSTGVGQDAGGQCRLHQSRRLPGGKSQEIANKIRNLQKQGAKEASARLRNAAAGDEAEGIATPTYSRS